MGRLCSEPRKITARRTSFSSPFLVLYSSSAECCHEISKQEQHSSSRTTPAVFQRLAFVPAVTVYVSVVGAQQEIEPRQHFHVQRNNHAHVVGPHTRYTQHTVVVKAVAPLYINGTPMFPLFDMRRPRDIKSIPSPRNLVM